MMHWLNAPFRSLRTSIRPQRMLRASLFPILLSVRHKLQRMKLLHDNLLLLGS